MFFLTVRGKARRQGLVRGYERRVLEHAVSSLQVVAELRRLLRSFGSREKKNSAF